MIVIMYYSYRIYKTNYYVDNDESDKKILFKFINRCLFINSSLIVYIFKHK